jgi:hypothetical protein
MIYWTIEKYMTKDKCTCPVLDNKEMPAGQRWVTVGCPIHDKRKQKPKNKIDTGLEALKKIFSIKD